MRKILMAMFFVVFSIVIINGTADATITGKTCSTCHTMHNSQNGTAEASGGPYEFLLRIGASGNTACWGCHADGSDSINAITGAPQVKHTDADLAAGNFAYIAGGKTPVTGDTETVGHNIKDTGVTDDNFSNYPPGDEFSQSGTITNANFTCAGTTGCHGDRNTTGDYASVKGAHHYQDNALKFGEINLADQAKTSGTIGVDVGSSYRFLKGVKGGEHSLWNKGANEDSHNEYFGADSPGDNINKATPKNNTISGLCAECHGNFHGAAEDIGSSTPWKRHPTDISLPSTGEYANYNSDLSNMYNLTVPVARTSGWSGWAAGGASSSEVTPSGTTDDIVMCLSCHRAHASQYKDMLRFDYTEILAGTGTSDTGCFVCHTTKNAD